ncbi:M20/M25/M40 family metallo-hydrolase [Sediminispirochaeta smaragdinae]|jgi:putative selenium metabolism hydrolase|uniref:Peptidase M20 n=1 Tax=Sediminispirochaeta smaragdinae (strain DSM 11293 / JCM 15392 / SEBR 4228) TaxID=573413 RepID=E1R8D0_SEDSS|nr:M20/M25/M40 family metallo-hydrolase [Sediminispirochaeta smaragdinae]ADK79274.1 peptidase M20 [Sediminispirochaeta smaragdinae DSM 11293]
MKLNSSQQKEVLAFARQLVCEPGNSGDEEKSALLIEKKMNELGYNQVRVDPYGSVIGIINGSKPGPTILFDGHVDVVPIHEPDEWHHDPYGGEVVGDKLISRGSADMKGSVTAMIFAASYLDKEKLLGTIIVSASVAEELIPGRALEKILDEYKVDAVVVGEPTKLRLGFTEKGRCSISMTVTGEVAHSSSPELGKNAIYIANDAIRRIREIPVNSDPFLGDEVRELVELRSEPTPGYGSVPYYCWGLWECRILPGESEQALLNKFVSSQKGSEWEERIHFQFETIDIPNFTGTHLIGKDFLPAWREDKNSGLYKQMEAAVEKSGIPVEYEPIYYGSNALMSCGVKKLPTVIFGPGDVALAHKPDEYLRIQDLWKATKIFNHIMELNGKYTY